MKKGEIRVIRNALSPSEFDALRSRLPRNLLYHQKTDAHVGQSGRKSVQVDIDSLIIGKYMLYHGIPPEYRVYYTGSHGMDWHRDERVLPVGIDYYECVLTLFNDSDSVFEYKDYMFTRTIRPTANTLIMLKPEDVKHRVTPITSGNREILKFVVVPTSMMSHIHNNTFPMDNLNLHNNN